MDVIKLQDIPPIKNYDTMKSLREALQETTIPMSNYISFSNRLKRLKEVFDPYNINDSIKAYNNIYQPPTDIREKIKKNSTESN